MLNWITCGELLSYTYSCLKFQIYGITRYRISGCVSHVYSVANESNEWFVLVYFNRNASLSVKYLFIKMNHNKTCFSIFVLYCISVILKAIRMCIFKRKIISIDWFGAINNFVTRHTPDKLSYNNIW